MVPNTLHLELARLLRHAEKTCAPCPPLREHAALLGLPTTVEHAYAVQGVNRHERKGQGDRVIGWKIGLTSKSVQQQLQVDSPDFGSLWASGYHGDGGELAMSSLIQPKVEAEVALVMEHDLARVDATVPDIIRATAFALPALEIVDSRIADWNIQLFDTVADNASASALVLGADPVRLDRLALRGASMGMTRNGRRVSSGIGSACLGHPLNAAAWLARTLARMGEPLSAGDIVLTGALGPMVNAARDDCFEASIEGLGSVAVHFV